MNKKTIIFGSIACVVLAIGAVLFLDKPTGGTARDEVPFVTQGVGDRQSKSATASRYSVMSWADRDGNSGTTYYKDNEEISYLEYLWYKRFAIKRHKNFGGLKNLHNDDIGFCNS